MAKNRAISALFEQEPTLASPPEVYFQVTRALNDPTANFEHIAAVLDKDPALTARILKLVNSSLYYRPHPITTVATAVGSLGLGPLSDLVLATAIKNRFDALFEGGPSLLDFWIRSVRRAVTAHEIAKFMNITPAGSPIFTSGLLLDIGELVIAAAVPDLACQVAVSSEPDAPPVHEVESSVLGFNRYDVGQELAGCWHFPPLISEAMQAVADPTALSLISESAQWVVIAQQLMLVDTDDPNVLRETFATGFTVGQRHLNINDDLESLLSKVNEHFNEIFYLFYQ